MALFGGRKSGGSPAEKAGRHPRHSSGWAQLYKHLKSREGLRILDIGPTSAGNINFVTNLGHSIYMANLAEDAARPEYRLDASEPGAPAYDVDKFLRQNLDFSGRTFDVVALWDAADYLPEVMLQGVVDRLFEVLEPGGQVLAFFHMKATGEEAVFSRYHLTESDQVEMQHFPGIPLLHIYNTRQIETLFKAYAGYKFFLAKDALREVIVTR